MTSRVTRRQMLKWGLTGVGLAFLSGCAPKATTPTPVPVAAQPTATPAQAAAQSTATVVPTVAQPTATPKPVQAQVKLGFWVNQPYARTKGLWESLVQEFEELNPGIKIESLLIPHNEYEPKILTGLAGGTVGDLLDVHPMHQANMALKGGLLPLDDLMPTLGVPESEMTQAWDYTIWRGKRWAIPRSDNPGIMMYNRAMVKNAGLPDPVALWKEDKWSIKAFDEMMVALSKGEGDKKVYGSAPATGSIRTMCLWLWGNNADVWSPDESKTVIDSPEALEVWDYITSWVRRGWTPSAAERNIPGKDIALLGQRRMVFYPTGAQFVLGGQGQYMAEDVMKEMQLVPYCTLWNGKREVRNATNSQGIYKKTKYVQEAWKWCQYIISDSAQSKILSNRWTSPLLKRHRNSAAWLGVLDPNLESPEIWNAALDNIRALSHPPRLEEMDSLIKATVDKMILGQAKPKEAIGEIVPKINTILQEVAEEVKEAGL